LTYRPDLTFINNDDISLTNIEKLFQMPNFIYPFLVFVILTSTGNSQTYSSETILMETPFGNMKIKLFEETPLHKKNFLKLVSEHFFDSTLFHRVINNFMIQGGDPLSKKAMPGDSLGHGDLGYTVPAEFSEKIIHKKGRLCAARESDDINPEFASSASQFYIVMGKVRTIEDLQKYEDRINKNHLTNAGRKVRKTPEGQKLELRYQELKSGNKTDSAAFVKRELDKMAGDEHLKTPLYKFNSYQVSTYTTVGGTPHLDGTYTVFGEVTEGIEVIDKIASVKTDKRDRPVEDVRIKVSILK
jgi:peptidylprolyl isomerase